MYTYVVTHKPTGKRYYGSRYAKGCSTCDLGRTYFTSSKVIRDMISEHGVDAFIFEVRRVFETKEQTVNWEFKVLRRLNAAHSDQWLNKHNGDGRVGGGMSGKTLSEHARAKIGLSKLGKARPDVAERNKQRKGKPRRPMTPAHRDAISRAMKGKKRPDVAARNRARAV